jgi:hypothetical protein
MKRKLSWIIATLGVLVVLFNLGVFDSERVALCKEAMDINAAQLKSGAEGRRKFIASCRLEANQITAEQWRCVIAAMNQGTAYRQALTQCQSTPG